jgi:hypothetical protein
VYGDESGLFKAYTCHKGPTGAHAVVHFSAARPNLVVEISSDDISPGHDPHESRRYPMTEIGPPRCNPQTSDWQYHERAVELVPLDLGKQHNSPGPIARSEEERAPQHGQFGHSRLLRATGGPCFSEESATDPTTSSTKNLRSPSQNSSQPDARPPLRLIINSRLSDSGRLHRQRHQLNPRPIHRIRALKAGYSSTLHH